MSGDKSNIDPFDGGDDTPLAPPPTGADPDNDADAPPSTGASPAPHEPPAPVAQTPEPPLAGDDGPIPQPITQPKTAVWRDDLEARGFKKDGFSDEDADFIDEARRNGWTPPDNFKGDPKGYVGPKKFVEQGRKSPAAVRRENTEMERQIKEMRDSQQRMEQQQQADRARAIQRGYQRAMQDVQQRKVEAWQKGDAKAMAQADKDMMALVTKKAQDDARAEMQAQSPQTQQVPEFISSWQSQNAWYGPQGDPDKTAFADSLVEYYAAQGYTQKALLDVVTRDVEARFGGAQAQPQQQTSPQQRETLTLPANRGFQQPPAGAEAPRQNAKPQATISQYDAGVQEAFGDFWDEHGPKGTGMYSDKSKAETAFLDMMKGW